VSDVLAARLQHAPAETAAFLARQDAEQAVISSCRAGAHEAEVMAAHQGSPTPAEHVANGATPASGG
jgi:hypothetical protein